MSLGAGLLMLGLAGSVSVASAQEREDGIARGDAGFGEEGQLAISTDAALEIRRRSHSGDGPSSTTLSILPAADYFIIPNLSVGGLIGVQYDKTGDSRVTTFQLGPRVGYDFELNDRFSIWPKVGLLYAHGKAKTDDYEAKRNTVQLNIFAPIMFHPAPHFFAGFGPFLETDLSGHNRTTQWGLKLSVGGWV